MKKNESLVATLFAGLIFFACCAPVLASTHTQQARLARQARITMKQARATAQQHAQGKIEGAELEREHGRLVYSFDIRNERGAISEVQVSAINGQVVSATEETPAQESAEHAAEQKEHKRHARTSRRHQR